MARMSSRGGQHSELGLMLPSTSTTRPPVSFTEDEKAAAQLYAIRKNLLQGGGAGALSQQQTAVYGSGSGGGGGGVVFNASTPLVNRRTAPTDDGEWL